MKPVYVIGPAVLLIAFGAYAVPASRQLDRIIERRAASAKQQAAETSAARTERERLAQAEQAQRTNDRKRNEAARAAEKHAAQLAQDAELQRLVASAETDRAALRREISTLDERLRQLELAREQADAAFFTTVRELELLKIERRSIDLELQRGTQVLAERVEAGLLAGLPIFPAPF